jgi:hypothetical protein
MIGRAIEYFGVRKLACALCCGSLLPRHGILQVLPHSNTLA